MNQLDSIVVLAPGHSEDDRRVMRTIHVLARIFKTVDVIFEARFALFSTHKFPKNVYIHYLYNSEPRFKIFPKFFLFRELIISKKIDCRFVYVHDGGLFGVLLVNYLKSKFAEIKLAVLDYHDSIEWEVYYQLSKVIKYDFFVTCVGRLLLKILSSYFYLKGGGVDAIIGISDSQVRSIEKMLKSKKGSSSLTIPNTREKLLISSDILISDSMGIDFLWVGNIVDGRDLPLTLEYLDSLSQEYTFKLYIFGKIISRSVYSLLLKRPYAIYVDEFDSDEKIYSFSKNKNIIGLFFGWSDKHSTGINEISSPNKMYTYINICIPTLYACKVNPEAFGYPTSLGYTFNSYIDFKNGYIEISKNYFPYRNQVYNSRDGFLWDSDLDLLLLNFYNRIFIN
jgi:hypothetical protein